MANSRPLDHNDELITMSERTEALHRNYLAEFEEKVWPIYQRWGYTKDTAMLAWMLMRVTDRQDDMIELLKECPCQDDAADEEPWEGEDGG